MPGQARDEPTSLSVEQPVGFLFKVISAPSLSRSMVWWVGLPLYMTLRMKMLLVLGFVRKRYLPDSLSPSSARRSSGPVKKRWHRQSYVVSQCTCERRPTTSNINASRFEVMLLRLLLTFGFTF